MKKEYVFLTLALAIVITGCASHDSYSKCLRYVYDEETATATISGIIPCLDEDYTNIVIPPTVKYNERKYRVTQIGAYAFYECDYIVSVIIPNSVTSLGDYAFAGCSNLTFIDIPRSVTSIGTVALAGCNLTSIKIPNSVTSIGGMAFDVVPNIVYTGFASGSPWGARSVNGYVDGDLIYKDKTKKELLSCSTTLTGEVVIPYGVASIGSNAFSRCKGLTSVTIPNSVTSIGDYAFCWCGNLTSVTVPNSVTSIGRGAFYDCPSMVIEIPERFRGCSTNLLVNYKEVIYRFE